MRLYNHINEKIEFTGVENKDKILKQVDKWKKDLRKLTKIYRSLDVPEDNSDIKEWRDTRKYFSNFRKKFEEWVYDFLLDKEDPKDENYFEREVRSKCWQAIMEIGDIMKEGYDAPTKQHGLDYNKTLKNREKKIREYNKKFNEAFKSINDWLKNETDEFKRFEKIKSFNYLGVDLIFDFGKDEDIKKWLPKMEDFVKNLKSLLDRVKDKNLEFLLKDLRVKLSLKDKDVGGRYDPTDDIITMTMWSFSDKNTNKVFFHELSHRFWFMSLPEELRNKWKNVINQSKTQITKEHIKEFVDKYYPFKEVPGIWKIEGNEEDLRNFFMSKNEHSEKIAIYAHLADNFNHRLSRKLKDGEDIKDQVITSYYEDVLGNTISAQYISEYANTDPSEAWAEAMGIWLTYQIGRLPSLIRYTLKDIFDSMGISINENSKFKDYLLDEKEL